MIRDAAHAYCQERLQPRVLEQFRHETTDPSIFREMGGLAYWGQPFLSNMVAQV